MTAKTIRRTLEKVACDVKETAPGRWSFGLDGDGPDQVVARLDEEWLLLEAVPPSGGHGEPWKLLRSNAGLSGFAKFALTPDKGALRLRAEIPLDGPLRTARRLERTCAGFRGESKGSEGPDDDPRETGLAELCEEAGWPYHERGDGAGAVTLDVREAFHQARLWATEVGVQARVALAELPDDQASWRQALAVLLLTGSALTRLARPVANGRGGTAEAGFEVRFAERPSAGELGKALSALSVACRMFASEAQALAEPTIAEAYLTLRGPESYRTTSRRQTAGARKGG